MRQLAGELGCSPMTPYRYFKDKDEILAAVRTAAFDRFSDALQAAADDDPDADKESLPQRVCRAYVGFALSQPHTYRLMFDLMQPDEEAYPALAKATDRARGLMTRHLAGGVADQSSEEQDRFGQAQWAAVHGALMLHLAGKLPAETEVGSLVEAMIQGLRQCASAALPA
jgi:AcrR family transcriptional regulator